MEKFMLIDGNSIIYRAFFAMQQPMTTSSGMHTNAVYGFTNMLLRLLEEEQPTHVMVAFDAGKITFRHSSYEDYKGGRQKTPPELSEQFPLLKDLLTAFGISHYQLEGYEADDIIGTLSLQAEQKGCNVLIISGDKDMLQLASEHVKIALTRKGVSEIEPYGPAEVQERYGLTPAQIIDLKGLMGDASDNIPGIPGVGEKTALKLLHQFGTVEEVLNNTDQLKGKMKEKVETHADDARLSKELATIFREVPFEAGWDSMQYDGIQAATAVSALQKLEFKSILQRLNLNDVAAHPDATLDDLDLDSMEVIQAPELNVIIIDENTTSELEQVLDTVDVVHVESHGDNPHHAELVGILFATPDNYYFLTPDTLKSEAAAAIRTWLADSSISKNGHDLHRADLVLYWDDIAFAGASFDIQIAAYLLDPTESGQSLSALAGKYGLPLLADDEHVFGKGAKYKVPEQDVLSHHMALKAHTIRQLVPLQREQLEQNEMTPLFNDLEMPLSRILADMEKQGVAVNTDELRALGKEFEQKISQLVSQIYEMAGTEFNLNSPKQLGEILFDRLGLPVKKKTKTGYSTSADVLEELAPYHDIVQYILIYRQIAKLQSTYVEGLLKEIHPKSGKVHTYFRQTITATGRLSSQYPNLQNIPIRLEEGRKLRKVFVPSQQGWSILAADYSQIELRVLADISNDPGLKDAFVHDMDIHTKTAMDVFGVSEDEVDGNMRRSAKAVNFGIVYGISDYGLSQNLGITRKEASEFINQYFDVFGGVRQYMDDIVGEAKKNGYVKTMLERRRYLPEIRSSNFNLRSFAERTAMNTPIQGTAADIIKLAMVHMDRALTEQGLNSRMLLQVHDELVFEVPADELEQMKTLVPQVMKDALKLSVPLKADVSYGANWYEAK